MPVARRLDWFLFPDEFTGENALMEGTVISDDPQMLANLFVKAISRHRFWHREKIREIPA